MFAMAVGPLWWSSFSESVGRRTIYLVSFTLFIVWSILGAVSTNIAMLLVMRLLSGGAAASVQAVGKYSLENCGRNILADNTFFVQAPAQSQTCGM